MLKMKINQFCVTTCLLKKKKKHKSKSLFFTLTDTLKLSGMIVLILAFEVYFISIF